MKELNLKKIFEAPYCRKSFQIGDSKCAVGKILSFLTDEEDFGIVSVNEYISIGNQKIKECLSDLSNSGVDLGPAWSMNDAKEGDPKLNHEKALKYLIQELLKRGIITLDKESLELSKEFMNKEVTCVQ